MNKIKHKNTFTTKFPLDLRIYAFVTAQQIEARADNVPPTAPKKTPTKKFAKGKKIKIHSYHAFLHKTISSFL